MLKYLGEGWIFLVLATTFLFPWDYSLGIPQRLFLTD